MGLKTFKGGIHPYDGKELTASSPVVDLKPKKDLVYPLSQHIGAPATALVEKGETVLRGQKIAEAGGFVSSPIYASVSGTVKAIEPRRVPTGAMVTSIVIENDNQYKEVEYIKCDDYTKLSKDEIITKIKEAGVVGMGGAGFPTHVKLSPKEPDKIEYIIANCAECEPYLTSDYRRMCNEPENLILGMKIVLSLFPTARGIFGIENNKPDMIEKLKELTKDEERMDVCPLMTKYPQGGERQLIHATTGRDINAAMLPADAGCIVHNVETLVAIRKAVVDGLPYMNSIFTVTGDAIANPGNFNIYVGMSYTEMLEAAGGFKTEPAKMISGGPMMGFALFDLDVPATKTSSALLCLTKDEASAYAPTACINCGRCVEACPENLIPRKLSDFAERGLKADFEKWYGLECINCGSCTYGCPARRHLSQNINSCKQLVLADKRAKK